MFYTLGRRAVTSVPRTPRNLLCSSQNTLFRFYSRDKETPVPVITLDKKKEQKTEDTLTEDDFLFTDTKQILDAEALFAIKKKKNETFIGEEPEFATVTHKYKEAEIQYPGGRTKEDVKIETEQFVEDALKYITTAHDGDVPFDKELYAQAKELKIKTFEEYQKFPEFGHDWGRSWVNWSPRGKKRTGHDRRFTSAVIEPFNQFLAPEVTKEHIEQVRQLPPGARNHLIIDVRGRMRYKDFQIPGSVNLPLDDISDGVFMFPEDVWKSFYKFDKPKAETKIILLSDNPDDSELAGWLFNFAGYKYTFNYRGGVRDWFGNEFKLVWMKNLTLADITRSARAQEGRVEREPQEDDVDRTPKMSKSQMLTKARELLNEDLPSVYDRRFYGLIN